MKKSEINILIPVYNEEKILEENSLRFMDFLDRNFNNKYKIIIVDGKSTDNTEIIGRKLEKKYKNISYVRTGVKGKGGQLKKAALLIDGDYFAFVDIDFPMKFEEVLQIINSIMNNEADIVIGTRNKGNKNINRPLMRKVASKGYNLLAKFLLNLPVTDTQCGIKAWNSKIKGAWEMVQDQGWFFDTDLLYHTIKQKGRIIEIPVSYSDRRKESKVLPYKDFIYFLRGLLRLKFKGYKKT